MATSTVKTNKPLNPRGVDNRPVDKYNRAELYSGKALDFDGVNDTLSTDYAPSSNIQTTAYWVKIDSLSANQVLGGFVSSTNQYGLYYWGARSDKNFGFNSWNSDSYGITLPDFVDDWFHIVAEYNFSDFTQSKLFVNGQELSISQTRNTTLQRTTASRTFKIDSPNTTTQEMNGKISGIKVFEGSLTADQVADLYNNPEKVVPTGVADSALKLWLPMQEGAGTTAYDGSGNGNHGTISGATWTHGIGAPVAQTAVIDWNKGTNLAVYSERFDNAAWTKNNLSISADDETAPDGQDTADKITVSTAGSSIIYDSISFATGDYMVSVYVKPGTSRYVYLRNQTDGVVRGTQWYDLQTATVGGSSGIVGDANIESANNGFYRISLECDPSGSGTVHFIVLGLTSSPTNAGASVVGEYVHAWGFQAERKTTLGPYVRTGATAQTSDVLLPQGLTTGRDITGVNLFENVRKQGALNLDGKSFAEVHKNDSVPEGGEDRTLEVWVYYRPQTTFQSMMELGEKTQYKRFAILAKNIAAANYIYIAGQSYDTDTSVAYDSNAWNHIVVTLEGSSQKVYKNGVLINTVSRSAYNTTLDTIEIGRNKENLLEYSYSSVAQPRIYSRALTATEVKQNYDATKDTYI